MIIQFYNLLEPTTQACWNTKSKVTIRVSKLFKTLKIAPGVKYLENYMECVYLAIRLEIRYFSILLVKDAFLIKYRCDIRKIFGEHVCCILGYADNYRYI